MKRMVTGSRKRRFGWLIRLLPVDIREAHGDEIRQVLSTADEHRPRGFIPGLAFLLGAAWDVLKIAPRQHADALGQDVRYTARGLRRSPVFAVAALATIAVGTGATLSVFAVVNAVLIRPLPFENSSKLALVWAINPEGSRTWLAAPELVDLESRARTLHGVAGLTDLRLALTGNGVPEELDVVAVSASFFQLLGTRPFLGRLLGPYDDRVTSERVVILSHSLWTRRFGSSPHVVGQTIVLDGEAYAIVGVLPKAFGLIPPSSVFPQHADAWVALQPHLVSRARDVRYLHAVARVRDDIPFATAREEISAVGAALSRDFGSAYGNRAWSFDLVPMKEDLVRGVRPALMVVLATVALVLLIASVNVAALLLARAESRRREMAVRAALGASRGRLTRQLLTEGFVLAGIGGILGSVLALAAPAIARVPQLGMLPRFSDVAIDWRVAGCAALLVCITAVLFAVAPALELSRPPARSSTLRSSSGSPPAVRLGRWLAASEVAIASAVLVVALLFAKNLAVLLDVEPGFTSANVFTARVALPPKYGTADAIARFFDEVLNRTRQLPGVDAVAAVTQLPLSGAALGSSFTVDAAANAPRRLDVDLRGVTHTYFETLEVPILRGRAFTSRDARTSPAVAIVDEITARHFWPGRDPIGQRMRWIRQPDVEVEVIGVAGSVRHQGVQHPARATVYRPHTQYARSTMYVVARMAGSHDMTEPALAGVVTSVDPDQPITDAITLAALRMRSFAQPGLGAALGTALALLALVLTAVGVYGVYAFAVVQRRREMGVRLAIGGTPARIQRLILVDGLRIVLLGLAAGVPGSLLASRLTATFVPGVQRFDPWAFAISGALMLGVALGACWLPARRASRVDPAVVLRADP